MATSSPSPQGPAGDRPSDDPRLPPAGDPVFDEGRDWLALAKPAGVPVFPPHRDPDGDCLLARLLAARPEQADAAWPQGYAGGLAHRLDVPTSGLVIAARSPAALARLRDAFAGGRLRKRYLFLTRRDVDWHTHVLDQPLAHDRRKRSRMVVQRGRSTPHRGRWFPAWTALRRVGRVAGDGRSYGVWEAEIRTGVTHQVRVHAAFAGLALAGDRRYGGRAPSPWAAETLVPRLGDERTAFLLHHVGLVGLDHDPAPLPPPAWWPAVPWPLPALPPREAAP